MSALGQKRSFARNQPDVRFASEAVIPGWSLQYPLSAAGSRCPTPTWDALNTFSMTTRWRSQSISIGSLWIGQRLGPFWRPCNCAWRAQGPGAASPQPEKGAPGAASPMDRKALPITSAMRFRPWAPLGIALTCLLSAHKPKGNSRATNERDYPHRLKSEATESPSYCKQRNSYHASAVHGA